MASVEVQTTFQTLDLLDIYFDILDDMERHRMPADETPIEHLRCIHYKNKINAKSRIRGTENELSILLKRLTQVLNRFRVNAFKRDSPSFNDLKDVLCKGAEALAKLAKSTESVSLESNLGRASLTSNF